MSSVSPERGVVVLLVDDHPVVRRGLKALLATQPWVRRIVEADGVGSALDVAGAHRPDVAVVDLGLPDGDGLELTRRLRAELPSCAVLVLTMTAEAGRARALLAAGASGYLAKETDPDLVVDSIRTVAQGGLVLGPNLDRNAVLAAETGPESSVPRPFDRLTPRELQIVTLVGAGRSNVEIARRLQLADKTVRNQVSSILVKIGARDRVDAARMVRDQGLA
jgi:two-component system nitrate/nitrite response regulator NarL